ncbi:MAG: hypothetical protein ACKOC5_10940, partial [Chloroflexota bacterium]
MRSFPSLPTIMRRLAHALLLAAVLLPPAAPAPAAPQSTFTVTLMTDLSGANDAAPGDGVCLAVGGGCTLRAAIQEANACAGADII